MTLAEYTNTLIGKRIDVIGAGVSNTPLIEHLLQSGCSVTVRDRNDALDIAGRLESLGARLRLGSDYLAELDADIIFRTPGMHPDTPELAAAKARGAVVTSEMELFFSLCPCKIIAITGSDGKTTTTTVIAMILGRAGFTVHLGGNIGRPLLTSVPNMNPDDFVVLELSSFQLHSMYCRPDIAVITNITPNHLDVHPDMADYINAKRQIFVNQDENCRLILNLDDETSSGFGSGAPGQTGFFTRRRDALQNGAFLRDGTVFIVKNGSVEALMPAAAIKIPGLHNVENYMAAFSALDGLVPRECFVEVAETFGGVSHRLELVRELRGVRYYNDSIASSPTRTLAGLRSFPEKTILIAGGYDKHIPFDELGIEIPAYVKALFLTGSTADSIRNAVVSAPGFVLGSLPISVIDDFTDAVLAAHNAAESGDAVLLSPACASFDKFKNFEQRGDFFREIVLSLE